MGQPIKFRKGDNVGIENILMLSESWIPEGKSRVARRAIFQCPYCDNTFETSLDHVKRTRGKSPVSCGCKLEVNRHKVGDIVGNNMEILEIIPKIKVSHNKYKEGKFKFGCKDCGRPFITTMEQVAIKGTTSCGCTLRKQKLYEGDMFHGFEVINPNHSVSKAGRYISTFKCKHCGTPFDAQNSIIRNGYKDSCGCTYVASKGEVALSNFIQTLYPNDTIKNSARVLELKEIDVLVENAKVGFEFNGLFWHSTARGKDQFYHINKTDMASQIDIKLFHIYEHHWKYKEHIVKDYLTKALHKQDFTVVDSDVSIKSVTQKEAKDFMKENSLYVYTPSEINLGLFIMNELVSLMSFQKDTLSVNGYEVINVTSKVGINIKSGFKKLLEAFEKDYQPESLTCLSNNALPIDYLLKDLGFNFHKRVLAKSYYFNPSNLEVLTKQKVNALLRDTDESLSEYERITEYGYLKYWDCGNDMYKK